MIAFLNVPTVMLIVVFNSLFTALFTSQFTALFASYYTQFTALFATFYTIKFTALSTYLLISLINTSAANQLNVLDIITCIISPTVHHHRYLYFLQISLI